MLKIQLLRVLFPSWKFFDEMGDTPELLLRESADGNSFTEWRDALPEQARTLSNLFLNPNGNLRLAVRSVVEKFLSELSELPDAKLDLLESQVSYQLLRQWVHFISTQSYYQFKVTARTPEGDNQEIVLSPEYQRHG